MNSYQFEEFLDKDTPVFLYKRKNSAANSEDYIEDYSNYRDLILKKIKKLKKIYGSNREITIYKLIFTKVSNLYTPHDHTTNEMFIKIFKGLKDQGLIDFENFKKVTYGNKFRIKGDRLSKITLSENILKTMDDLLNKLYRDYPNMYRKLWKVQEIVNLPKVTSEDITQSGLLLVEYWEGFSDQLWKRYRKLERKPSKNKTLDKLSPFLKENFTAAEKDYENSLFKMFKSMTNLNERIKHGNKESRLRNSRWSLIITIIISEELLLRLK